MNTTENNKEEDRRGLWKRMKNLFRSSPKTTEDMVAIVDAATENEIIDSDAKRIIEGALEVSEKQARDIMVPRTQMTVLKASDSFSDNLEKIISSGHSRYPVIGETIDDVLGLLLVKDLLGIIAEMDNQDGVTGSTVFNLTESHRNDIRHLLRPPVFVPESKRLNVLLRQFREDRNHMALVIDEYGSLAGLVTIEDVLEEIVGEIEDEHDSSEEKNIRQVSNTHYIVSALTPIEDFNDYFEANFEAGEFDTIGGIITNKFGHLPKRNEMIDLDRFTFHIMQADKRRLHMLRMTVKQDDDSAIQDAANT